MTETISGLLTQKPGRDPEVGTIKCYTVEKRTSATGKDWLKVKNATPDKGGLNYRILKAEPTGFEDSHGNVSFNVELERSNDFIARAAATIPEPHQTPAIDPVGACKGHLERASQAMLLCLETAEGLREAYKLAYGHEMTHDQYQAITSTLFIHLDRTGLIASLPSAPIENK
jgi:hypothetical protein